MSNQHDLGANTSTHVLIVRLLGPLMVRPMHTLLYLYVYYTSFSMVVFVRLRYVFKSLYILQIKRSVAEITCVLHN